ncbi:hypothetical protein TPHA_0G00320 [Tetrapisispora phaffii CBS 4417]|uniref:Mediator of RNA polymerase II transcription subunit 10 n=1 Tax=Tetrapisispora phaffii (strain ATCC 24235 / CBS 4417 / NBRC 1672 / NRRL Y-8282 / UCD 70-5) TaxID=1071381 RepID=G8BVE2_TETPH|nr:hypothetical protein TPHA_0G00320 [Tetrapisispora phaffii CBS 4417]CCE63870.1 hypothetical protein TPHA_0G00320 [Tetrapisispora phaffii CBS 4417]
MADNAKDTANANASANAKLQEALENTEEQVTSIIESFIELGVSIYDYPGTPEATQGMITNLKRNVDRLSKLNQSSNTVDTPLQDINIPFEVIQYIEDGRNPDIYTREFVEAIRRSNQYQRAKMNGLKQLRDSLAEKISEEFPELVDTVQNIIERTTPKETMATDQKTT